MNATSDPRRAPVVYYLHHAGGLPCTPANLRPRTKSDGAVIPLPLGRSSSGNDTIEDFAATAEEHLHDSAAGGGGGPRILYGHSMGALVAYELCRSLGSATPQVLDAVVLAASAPWWLLRRPALDLESVLHVTSERMRRELAAVVRYRPDPAPFPRVPTHVLYANRDPLVPGEVALMWTTVCERLRVHEVDSDSHLFHTDRGASSFARQWHAMAATLSV